MRTLLRSVGRSLLRLMEQSEDALASTCAQTAEATGDHEEATRQWRIHSRLSLPQLTSEITGLEAAGLPNHGLKAVA